MQSIRLVNGCTANGRHILRSFISITLLTTCLTITTTAKAEIVKHVYDFRGEVTTVNDACDLTDWEIGTTVNGTITYDPSVVGVAQGQGKLYQFGPPTADLDLGISGSIGSKNFDFKEGFTIFVVDDSSNNTDYMDINATKGVSGTIDFGVLRITLIDAQNQIFSSDSLPSVSLDLSHFNDTANGDQNSASISLRGQGQYGICPMGVDLKLTGFFAAQKRHSPSPLLDLTGWVLIVGGLAISVVIVGFVWNNIRKKKT